MGSVFVYPAPESLRTVQDVHKEGNKEVKLVVLTMQSKPYLYLHVSRCKIEALIAWLWPLSSYFGTSADPTPQRPLGHIRELLCNHIHFNILIMIANTIYEIPSMNFRLGCSKQVF